MSLRRLWNLLPSSPSDLGAGATGRPSSGDPCSCEQTHARLGAVRSPRRTALCAAGSVGLLLIPLWAPAAFADPELRQLALPHGLEVTDKVQALLDEGNGHVAKGYALLIDKSQPELAIREFTKALAIQTRLDAMVPPHETINLSAAEAQTQAQAFVHATMAHLTEISPAHKPQQQVNQENKERDAQKQAQAQGQKAAGAQKQVTQQLANQPKPAPGAASQPAAGGGKQDDLTAKQNQIAADLNKIAAALGNHPAGKAFEKAAAAAAATAQQIAAGQAPQAQAQSAQTEAAIAAAIRLAAAAGTDTLQDLVHNLQMHLSDTKDQQSTNLTQLQDLQKPSAGGEADLADKTTRTVLVAVHEANLKQDIDEIQKELENLAGAADPAVDRSSERAAREDLGQALHILQSAKTRQNAIDATMDVRSGELKSAGESMARAQQSLQEASDQVAAAAEALSAGQSQAKRDYEDLQRVSSGLRQIVSAAEAFTAGPSGPARNAPVALPPAVAEVFDASLARLHRDLLNTVDRPTAAVMPGLPDARALARAKPELARDPATGLDQLRTLITALETLEGQLALTVDKEQERAATHDYLKDPIPAAYQKQVSQYFEALSK